MNTATSQPIAREQAGKLERWFWIFAGVTLFATATVKLLSAWGDAGVMKIPDPLLSVSYRTLMLAAAAAEFAVTGLLVLPLSPLHKRVALAWLSSVFLLYRLGNWFVGSESLCPCLGTLTSVLHVPEAVADKAMLSVAVLLAMGSYAGLLATRTKRRIPDATVTAVSAR